MIRGHRNEGRAVRGEECAGRIARPARVYGAFVAGLTILGFGVSTGGCIAYEDPDLECGANAYADQGRCLCLDGYDGDPEEGCDPVQTWLLTDACDDRRAIEWKLFALATEAQWPGPDELYRTSGLDNDDYVDIKCDYGETICFGGAAGSRVWGVGLSGDLQCEDCCFRCYPDLVDLGVLSCPD